MIVGDCHGEKPEIPEEDFEAVIATGDICGDPEEARDAMFKAIDSEETWHELVGEGRAEELVEKSLEQGEEVLRFLNSLGKPVYLVPGNWDWSGEETNWDYLEENRFQNLVDQFENIRNINERMVELENFSLIGYGPCSGPELPQHEDDKPDSEEELEEMREDYKQKKEILEELFEEAEKKIIFLSHNVPHNTSLDEITNEDSPAQGRHYGSIIVRELIEEFQPVLSVAGHMHEGEGREEIRNALCINAGLENTELIDL